MGLGWGFGTKGLGTGLDNKSNKDPGLSLSTAILVLLLRTLSDVYMRLSLALHYMAWLFRLRHSQNAIVTCTFRIY